MESKSEGSTNCLIWSTSQHSPPLRSDEENLRKRPEWNEQTARRWRQRHLDYIEKKVVDLRNERRLLRRKIQLELQQRQRILNEHHMGNIFGKSFHEDPPISCQSGQSCDRFNYSELRKYSHPNDTTLAPYSTTHDFQIPNCHELSPEADPLATRPIRKTQFQEFRQSEGPHVHNPENSEPGNVFYFSDGPYQIPESVLKNHTFTPSMTTEASMQPCFRQNSLPVRRGENVHVNNPSFTISAFCTPISTVAEAEICSDITSPALYDLISGGFLPESRLTPLSSGILPVEDEDEIDVLEDSGSDEINIPAHLPVQEEL